MAHRVRSALVWGTASLFLVGILAQDTVLLGLGISASFGVVVAMVVASSVVVTFVTYVIKPRLERKGKA